MEEAHDGAKEETFGGLTEVSKGNVSGRIEAFNGLAEGSTLSDVLQSKCGNNGELPPSKISELMKLGNLESASTNSLLSVVNRILEECIERNNNEGIPLGVGSVLKLVVLEIEQRVSKQADNMRKQTNLYKSREDRYQSRIRALETLTIGTSAENEVTLNQLQQIKIEKTKIEEMQKLEEQALLKLRNEKQICDNQISWLNEEQVLAKKSYKENLFQLEAMGEEVKANLQKKIVELELLLSDSMKNIKELEECSESRYLQLKRKEQAFRNFINSQFQSLEDLKSTTESLKQEVIEIRNSHAEEFYQFVRSGLNLSVLMDVAKNYHSLLAENRKLYNEVQDLKGNIRVYCRIRPFLSGQSQKQTTVQYVGENGELVVLNSSKPGKDGHRLFKFNKVFGPAATQEEVFRDTQPLIRSVLDGYNVCIFAYGQTGSGKTYTMTGPNMASIVDWGVNYRALNDLFNISQKRRGSFAYDIGVQMVEIYNEQVRDLLRNDNFQKRLGIWSTSQPNGLAVPDASLNPVKSTSDVLELMNIGLMNRAVGATALNERSSRSHSILTVHVRGTDLETNGVLRGCLHLVDLAGSERVERSEATGDRLREAQHINKSLSALGDVIFALAQNSPHVPYRNSKLTQVLQSSLGGQAKTLMFVQLNPDVESYSETISTLKFAERVSGVELGAARSNKEGRDVTELMQQVASLKDALAKKDEEIGRLRLRKTHSNIEGRGMTSQTHGYSSPRRHSLGGVRPSQVGKSSSEKAASDNSSQYSDKHSEASSQQSLDDFKHHKEFFRQSRLAVMGSENFANDICLKFDAAGSENDLNDDVVLVGLGDEDSERLSDISDGVLSMGTETDGSISSIVEYTLFPEITNKPCDEITERPTEQVQSPKQPTTKTSQSRTSRISLRRSSSMIPSSKPAIASSTFSARKPPKRWQ